MAAPLAQMGTLQDASRAEQLLLHCSSNSQKLELLDCVFKANLYKPQDVVTHGTDLLKRGSLGNVKYRIQEQTCVACIDTGLWQPAADLVKALKQAFPQSLRVKRLEVAIPQRPTLCLVTSCSGAASGGAANGRRAKVQQRAQAVRGDSQGGRGEPDDAQAHHCNVP